MRCPGRSSRAHRSGLGDQVERAWDVYLLHEVERAWWDIWVGARVEERFQKCGWVIRVRGAGLTVSRIVEMGGPGPRKRGRRENGRGGEKARPKLGRRSWHLQYADVFVLHDARSLSRCCADVVMTRAASIVCRDRSVHRGSFPHTHVLGRDAAWVRAHPENSKTAPLVW